MILTPYGSLFYFVLLIFMLIPAIWLGIREKSLKKYGFIFNIFMILFMFMGGVDRLIYTVLFIALEMAVINRFLASRQKEKSMKKLLIAIFIALIPFIFFRIRSGLDFVGLSYLTFRVLQILIEIHDGLIEKVDKYDTIYFILFFPTFTSGPVDRSRRFIQEINAIPKKNEYLALLREGIWKTALGVSYKFIFAALIAEYWMDKVPKEINAGNVISYMYAYGFYLFFDFAGYSLMAVGSAYILGIKVMDNFNMPFISKDIKDFWNRWHMSVSFWFRDFVYTRFVMMAMKKEWFKSKYTASYIGYLITMGSMGLWHGTKMFYLVYGIYHGILISATDYYQRKSGFHKKNKNKLWYQIVSVLVTFHIVLFGFLIFSGHYFNK